MFVGIFQLGYVVQIDGIMVYSFLIVSNNEGNKDISEIGVNLNFGMKLDIVVLKIIAETPCRCEVSIRF